MAMRAPLEVDEQDAVAVHRLTFAGGSAGSRPLTWAQLAELDDWTRLDPDEHAGNDVRCTAHLPATDVSGVWSAVRSVVLRHEGLRTRLRRDDAGSWVQVVSAAGELTVLEFAQTDPADTFTFRVLDFLTARPFAADDLPVRMALITADGRPVTLVVALWHMIADGLAAEVVARDIRLFCDGPDAVPPVDWQPGEIAAYERGPRGQDHARRTDDHLRRQLRRAAPVPPVRAVDPVGELRYFCDFLDSTAAAAATVILARRLRMSRATVLLTGYARSLCDWLGQTSVTVLLMCANRGHPRMRTSVANLAQGVPVTLDLSGGDFATQCRAIADATLLTYRYGHHDPERYRRAVADAERARGEPVSVPFIVNLRGLGLPGLGGEVDASAHARMREYATLTGDDLEALQRDTKFREFSGTVGRPFETIEFTLWLLSDIAEMMLMANEHSMTADVPRRLLAALEHHLVEAVRDLDAADEVTAGFVASGE